MAILRHVFQARPVLLALSLAMVGWPPATVWAAELPPQQEAAPAADPDADQTIANLTQEITANPQDKVAYYKRAFFYMETGHNDLAMADLNQSVSIDPQFSPAYVHRAYLYMLEDDDDRALSDLNLAIQLNPQSSDAYFHRSFVYLTKKFDDQAIADLNQVIQLDPHYTLAYFRRARVNMAKGFYDRAIADFQETIRQNPKDVKAYNALAWLMATCPQKGLRDGARAVDYATKACELTQWTSAPVIDTLAAACATAGDFAGAVKWESKFLEMTHSDTGSSTGAQGRLALYQSRQAYHVDKYDLQLIVST